MAEDERRPARPGGPRREPLWPQVLFVLGIAAIFGWQAVCPRGEPETAGAFIDSWPCAIGVLAIAAGMAALALFARPRR
jgi:hypothetical protein